MKKTMFAVLAGLLAMGVAQAQTTTMSASAAEPHVYLGVGVGAVKDSVSGDYKRSKKIFGGYEFDQNWGVEAGYSYLGKTGFTVPLAGDSTYAHVKSQSFYVAAKYKYALTERTSIYGKLGLSRAQYKYSSQSPAWDFRQNENGVYGAIGLQTRITDRVSLFTEYERNGKRVRNGPENQIVSAGVKFDF